MGFFSFLDPVLETLFGPLLSISPFWFVLIISAGLSLLIVLIYKFTTNQQLMKRLKDEIKELQKELKTLKGHPEKMMEVNKRMMETNMKYMMQSFKATFFTFIPIIIIYTFLSGAIAFDPILPGQEFSVTVSFAEGKEGFIDTYVPDGLEVTGEDNKEVDGGQAIFTYRGDPGTYLITYEFDETTYGHEVLITNKRKYLPMEKKVNDDSITTIHTDLDKLIVLNLFGWKVGWFGSYILFSILFSILFRRLMKVY
jgi:uncharacterized membrane protein (DUF106 family)